MWHEFAFNFKQDEFSWIPGKINLANVVTKPDSPLTESLQLTMFTVRMKNDFSDESDTKSAEKNYG